MEHRRFPTYWLQKTAMFILYRQVEKEKCDIALFWTLQLAQCFCLKSCIKYGGCICEVYSYMSFMEMANQNYGKDTIIRTTLHDNLLQTFAVKVHGSEYVKGFQCNLEGNVEQRL